MPSTPPFRQPDPHDSTRGRIPNPVWTQHTTPVTAAGARSQPLTSVRRRGPWFWVIVVFSSVVVLALSNCAGLVIGYSAAGQAPAQLSAAQQALDDAGVEIERAASGEAEARSLVEACEQQAEALQEDLDEAVALAATGGADLDTANTRVRELEASIATLEARISELEASLASAQAAPAPVPVPAPAAAPARPAPAAAPAPAPVPAPAAAPVQPAPANVYYANCTAARNAGAAPVRQGDPGYGTHLDRDRDGVGCE